MGDCVSILQDQGLGSAGHAKARTEESGGAPVQHEPMESRGFSESAQLPRIVE